MLAPSPQFCRDISVRPNSDQHSHGAGKYDAVIRTAGGVRNREKSASVDCIDLLAQGDKSLALCAKRANELTAVCRALGAIAARTLRHCPLSPHSQKMFVSAARSSVGSSLTPAVRRLRRGLCRLFHRMQKAQGRLDTSCDAQMDINQLATSGLPAQHPRASGIASRTF